MVHHIQQVKQLKKQFKRKETLPESTWNMRSKQTNVGTFERLNIQSTPQIPPQQSHISVWPSMLYPTNFMPTHSFPYCNCKNINHFEIK